MRRENLAAILLVNEDQNPPQNPTLARRIPVALGKYSLPVPYVIARKTRGPHSGQILHERGLRPEEMHAISGSLALITNLVIGWTSLQIQAALAALKSRRVVFSPEVLRHVSPIRYRNINFRGTFKFPFEKYLVALLGEDASAHGKSMHG